MRRLAYEAADCGLLSSDLAAGIRRVQGVKKLGVRLGNWLPPEQGQAPWRAPDRERLEGKRDRALLALLLACFQVSAMRLSLIRPPIYCPAHMHFWDPSTQGKKSPWKSGSKIEE